jgi:hypothetical protein
MRRTVITLERMMARGAMSFGKKIKAATLQAMRRKQADVTRKLVAILLWSRMDLTVLCMKKPISV